MGMVLFLFLFLFLFFSILGTNSDDHIERGFSARPEPWSSSVEFQSVLTDSTSTFSLGFLRCGGGVDSSLLELAIIHLPSSFPLWRAVPSQPSCTFSWSTSTSLLFNGSLILIDSSSSHSSSCSWSTNTPHGDRLTLLSSSNLQITNSTSTGLTLICWQSFDFPSDSIIQNQNFTSTTSLLSSHNHRYSMKLGTNFIALYYAAASLGVGLGLGVGNNNNNNNNMIMYWKHTAMETKAQIVDGRGPIYARIDPTGFLGLYQTEKALVDILPFDTFNAGTPKTLRRLTLESDGNLRAYYYYSNISEWVPDFAAISSADRCSLPAVCGAYGVCHMVHGNARCGCLDNRTATEGCFPGDSGDLCGNSRFGVVRRRGVELANKLEFMNAVSSFLSSLEECESWCERNCSCWGALYSNTTSGYCYRIDYPIQTLLAVGDQRKIGYFKIRNNIIVTSTSNGGGEEEEGWERRRARVVVVLGMLILVCGCGFAGYRVWRRRRTGGQLHGVVPEARMPSYKPLISTFRNIELTNSSLYK